MATNDNALICGTDPSFLELLSGAIGMDSTGHPYLRLLPVTDVSGSKLVTCANPDGEAGMKGLFGFDCNNDIAIRTAEGCAAAVPGGAAALSQYGMFYGLTAGTGNGAATDYAATVAVKTAAGTGRVPFPRLGPAVGGVVVNPLDATKSFLLPAIGTYEITFRVHTTEPGQLQLELNGAAVDNTTAANMNPTAGGHPIVGNSFITTTAVNSILAVINPAGNTPALTITPADGASTHANAQTLTIKLIG